MHPNGMFFYIIMIVMDVLFRCVNIVGYVKAFR